MTIFYSIFVGMKSMLIDEKIHGMLKSHCVENGLVMRVLIEKLIIEELKKQSNHE